MKRTYLLTLIFFESRPLGFKEKKNSICWKVDGSQYEDIYVRACVHLKKKKKSTMYKMAETIWVAVVVNIPE